MAGPDPASHREQEAGVIAPLPASRRQHPAGQVSQRRRSMTGVWPAWLSSPWVIAALVLGVAAFFRLWQIGTIPPGLFGDEATDGLDALDVLAGRGAVFFPANFGREGLHMWIVAGFFRLLGITSLALRLPSVIAGILTALATLWLGVELARSFGTRTAPVGDHPPLRFPAITFGLLAALYLSTSYFHVHFSRFGIRGVFTPLCAALAFAAFWRGVNLASSREQQARSSSHTYLWFALSGLFLGLGTHFYTASRFMPLFLGGFLAAQAAVAYATGHRERAILVRHFGPVVVLFVVAALVFAPLGLYFVQHPGSFSQRASEVSAFKAGSPWQRMGQAALANVLQFLVPGRGDTAQFYNLPGRPVFDPLTAVLAVIGIAALIYRIRQPGALFLLLWWPALLLPSFLATDRFPTLPRVLGTIPGIYFFPAAGILGLVALCQGVWARRGDTQTSSAGARVAPILLAALATLALLVHAGFTYRDYFLTWGRSTATYDAFEEDMTQAAGWLAANHPAEHVYLSSDIYRHPTFMLLYEHATVTRYFADTDPNLSWFDARTALPLPPPGESAVYVMGASALPAPTAAAYLPGSEALSGAGQAVPPMLAVTKLNAAARQPAPDREPEAFSDRLGLIGASWLKRDNAAPALQLYWRTAGPDPAGWAGYRLQIDGDGWQVQVPFDDFRAPEWVLGGSFLTWRDVKLPDDTTQLPSTLRLRLIEADKGEPLTTAGAPDGWHTVTVNER